MLPFTIKTNAEWFINYLRGDDFVSRCCKKLKILFISV